MLSGSKGYLICKPLILLMWHASCFRRGVIEIISFSYVKVVFGGRLCEGELIVSL